MSALVCGSGFVVCQQAKPHEKIGNKGLAWPMLVHVQSGLFHKLHCLECPCMLD